MLGRDVL